MAASFGKMPVISVRRLISALSLSSGLVLCIWVRWSFGKLTTARRPFRIYPSARQALGTSCAADRRRYAAAKRRFLRILSEDGAYHREHHLPLTLLACASALRMKCTRQQLSASVLGRTPGITARRIYDACFQAHTYASRVAAKTRRASRIHLIDPAVRRAAIWLTLQVIACPAAPAQLNVLRLRRSPHVDFLGPWQHEGIAWLTDRSKAWLAEYYVRCWKPFMVAQCH